MTKAVSQAKTKETIQDISAVKLVPIALIDVESNIRTEFDEATLADLAEDIKERGLLQPVLLNPKVSRFTLIAGERRVRACILAGMTAIPALLTKASKDDAKLMQLAENIQRENLNLQDEAAAIRYLFDRFKSLDEVANKVKKSKSWVSKRLALSEPTFCWQARALIENGVCEDLEIVNAVSQAYKIDWQKAEKLLHAIKQGEIDRDNVRKFLAEMKKAEKAKASADKQKQQQTEKTQKEIELEEKKPPLEITLRRLVYTATEITEIDQAINDASENERQTLLENLKEKQTQTKTINTLKGFYDLALEPANVLLEGATYMALMGQEIDNLYAFATLVWDAKKNSD